MKNFSKLILSVFLLLIVAQNGSCKKDSPEPKVVAGFTFLWNTTDYKIVSFTSTSENYKSLSWNFGDNSAISTETNPVHIFPAAGVYTVTLTATSPGGVTDSFSEDVTVNSPDPEVIASFTYVVDGADYLKVSFTSTAQNFETLVWNFGDNSSVSTEINPVHIFPVIGVYTVVLTATSTEGDTDVYSKEIVVADPDGEIGKAMVWLTKGNKTKLFSKEADLSIMPTNTTTYPVISVDTATKFQEIEGFGAALTGSSAYLFNQKLDATARAAALNDLFDPSEGIGISYLRLSIGASDFSLSEYSYDDMPAGQTDYLLEHFSLQNDQADVIPVLKEILQISPEISILGSPWSPPAWMKTNGNMRGGKLKTVCYEVYADYFVKYIQAMQTEGINIAAITIQNEPLFYTADYPCMEMQPAEQMNFIKNNLGPKFQNAGISTKIIIYDHNWDNTNYAISILNDQTARSFIAGSAFHAYAGDVSAMTTVHNAHPDKDLYFTEISGGTWATDFAGNLMWNMQNIFIGTTLNWSKSALLWNLALDQNGAPHSGNSSTCRGVFTINNASSQITKNEEYYSIAHFSKYVRPGAIRVSTVVPQSLPNTGVVAFQNPDGTKAMVISNYSNETKTFSVKQGIRNFSYSLSGQSVVTLVW
jgi:glucosylceramidase